MPIQGLIRDRGNAYRLNNGELETAPILTTGEVEDNWFKVEFEMIEQFNVDYCNAVKAALVLQIERDIHSAP